MRCPLYDVAHCACGAAELGARLHSTLTISPGLMASLLGGLTHKPSGGGGKKREVLPLPVTLYRAPTDEELASTFGPETGQTPSREGLAAGAKGWLLPLVHALNQMRGKEYVQAPRWEEATEIQRNALDRLYAECWHFASDTEGKLPAAGRPRAQGLLLLGRRGCRGRAVDVSASRAGTARSRAGRPRSGSGSAARAFTRRDSRFSQPHATRGGLADRDAHGHHHARRPERVA